MNVTESMQGAPQCVIDVVRGLQTRNYDLISGALAHNAKWTMVGRQDRFAFGGPKTKDELIEIVRTTLDSFQELDFELLSWAQNEEIVFIEAHTNAAGPGGARYSNRYIMRFTLANGVIVEVLEHFDPFEVLAYIEQMPS